MSTFGRSAWGHFRMALGAPVFDLAVEDGRMVCVFHRTAWDHLRAAFDAPLFTPGMIAPLWNGAIKAYRVVGRPDRRYPSFARPPGNSRAALRARPRHRRHGRCAVASTDRARCRAHGQGARMEPVLPPGGAFEVEQHASERMADLGITETQVRETLERPDEVRPADDRPPTDPCNIYLRVMDTRRCKVYVRVGSDPMRVATVRWHGE